MFQYNGRRFLVDIDTGQIMIADVGATTWVTDTLAKPERYAAASALIAEHKAMTYVWGRQDAGEIGARHRCRDRVRRGRTVDVRARRSVTTCPVAGPARHHDATQVPTAVHTAAKTSRCSPSGFGTPFCRADKPKLGSAPWRILDPELTQHPYYAAREYEGSPTVVPIWPA